MATGILSVQCGVLDPNRDLMSSVWRAGPQPRYCEFSVACWTPTAILRVECGVLDPNRDIASSVSVEKKGGPDEGGLDVD